MLVKGRMEQFFGRMGEVDIESIECKYYVDTTLEGLMVRHGRLNTWTGTCFEVVDGLVRRFLDVQKD